MKLNHLCECKIPIKKDLSYYPLKFEEIDGKIRLTIKNEVYIVEKADIIKALEFITRE